MNIHPLEETWRWFGPADTISLQHIRQTGATGIVSALHEIPHGDLWPVEQLQARKRLIESGGFNWKIVESIPVHEDIKTRSGRYLSLIETYKQNLRNAARIGIKTVCYNFMPVLDWTRTGLMYPMPDGSRALRFDWTDLALFDVHILKRKGAQLDYNPTTLEAAENRLETADRTFLQALSETVLMGVPGEASITPDMLLNSIDVYKQIGPQGFRENLSWFLEQIMDTCQETGIKMTIHPDDPPFNILGLPRIVSNLVDLEFIINKIDREENGVCFCTGSLGACVRNDLPAILRVIGNRVHFVHLRNTRRDEDANFTEAAHLDGDTDMYEVMKELINIQSQRKEPIPFRPDHGHQMLDDLSKSTAPGYSAIGRLKGLAELRGLALSIYRGTKGA